MENKLGQVTYAGFWIRAVASLLDTIVTIPLLVAVAFIVAGDYTVIVTGGNISYTIASWLIMILYGILFYSSKIQATPGKWICGIYVLTIDGQKLTKLRALARFFATILSSVTVFIGFFMIGFTKQKTGLHDLICSTRVIYGKPRN